ncbi:AMMECR1-like protein [Physcia stellaris]|nr:AMMECR1-like protein [Physcia stellaris]
MATTAHCLYCFETLAATLEKRPQLSLSQVEGSWSQYQQSRSLGGAAEQGQDTEMTQDEEEPESSDGGFDVEESEEEGLQQPTPSTLQLPSISRLQAASPSSASTVSTPSSLSTTSSQAALGGNSKSSSKSSFFSFSKRSQEPSPAQKEEEYPLFVTWNSISSRGHKTLRGCIGTFDAKELSEGLASYALTAAFDDTRFSPIALSELATLATAVTLLADFTPALHPMDWDLGIHGIKISFTHQGKRYGATYLPDVAVEQGWTKEQTIVSLMRKAGWVGRSADWKKVSDLRVTRYTGAKANIHYAEWKQWRDWVEGR